MHTLVALIVPIAAALVAVALRAWFLRFAVGRITFEVPSWRRSFGASLAATFVGVVASVALQMGMQSPLVPFAQLATGFVVCTIVDALAFELTPGAAIGTELLVHVALVIASLLVAAVALMVAGFPLFFFGAASLAGGIYWLYSWKQRQTRLLLDSV